MATGANFWVSTQSVDYGSAGNWTDGVPDAGDTVYAEKSNIDMGATLDQSAVTLAAAYFKASYTGKVGLCNLSATPNTPGTYLQLDTAILNIGRIDDAAIMYNGSPRLMIDLGSNTACATTIESTSQFSADTGLPPVRLKGAKSTHTIRLWQGHIGVAVGRSDETSTFGTIHVGKPGIMAAGNYLSATLGAGVTISTLLNVNGGKCLVFGAIPSAAVYGGTLIHRGAGTVSGTVTVYPGARYIWEGTGTAAAVTVKNGATFDFSNGSGTITTLTFDNKHNLLESSAVTVTTRTFTGKEGGAGESIV